MPFGKVRVQSAPKEKFVTLQTGETVKTKTYERRVDQAKKTGLPVPKLKTPEQAN